MNILTFNFVNFTCSWVVLVMVLFVTNITSCGKGDNEGEGWSLGLAGIDGDGLGVRNGPGGESIPVKRKRINH